MAWHGVWLFMILLLRCVDPVYGDRQMAHYDARIQSLQHDRAVRQAALVDAEQRRKEYSQLFNDMTREREESLKTLSERRTALEYEAKRMQLFQTWNAFASGMSVAWDGLQKINPGTAGAATANFVADRLMEAGGGGDLRANMSNLRRALDGTSPAQIKLQESLNLDAKQVAQRMADEGLLTSARDRRRAESGEHRGLVTAANRYIQEAIREVLDEIAKAERTLPETFDSARDELRRAYNEAGDEIETARDDIERIDGELAGVEFLQDAYRSDQERAAATADSGPTPDPPPAAVPTGDDSVFRSIGDLDEEERMALLNCLCRASLGASIGVQAGYNLTIPAWADPQIHSCGSLANGPCMASGFGCWRSFIDFSSEAARNCLAGFGLNADDPDVVIALDRFNQEVEEDLQVTLRVEPMEYCPGDEVRVSVVTTGGRGNYTYSYSVSDQIQPSGVPTQRTTDTSFTFTVGASHYPLGTGPGATVFVRAMSPTAPNRPIAGGNVIGLPTGVPGQYQRVQIAQDTVQIRMRPRADCEEKTIVLPPPPTTPPRRRPPPTTSPPEAGQPPADRTPSRPPTTPPTPSETPPRLPTAPSPATPPTSPPPGLPPPDPKVAGTDASLPTDTVAPYPADIPPVPPDADPTPPTNVDSVPVRDPVAEEDCAECLIIGGGADSSVVIVTDSTGQLREELRQTRYYSVEGCPGQLVRLTVVGTDGFREQVEGIDGPVVISRIIGSEAGEDTITAENLSLTDCSLTWTSAFEPIASNAATIMDLRGAEAVPVTTGSAIREVETAALDIFDSGRVAERQRQRDQAALSAQQQLDMTRGARAGDAGLRNARQTRTAGGRDAQQTRRDSARTSAQAQRESSWGTTLGNAVTEGVQTGLETFAETVGREAADQASRDLFGTRRADREAARQPAASTPVAAAGPAPVAGSAPPKIASAGPEAKPGPQAVAGPDYQPVADAPATEPAAKGVDCDFCTSTAAQQVTTSDGGRSSMCSGCKAIWTCTACGKITTDIGGASYTARDAGGNAVWSGSIDRACQACSDAWLREQQAKWGAN